MIKDELQQASYKGAFFFLTTAGTSGGRKDSIKEIVNADTQIVEDLGGRTRTFSISGVVAARFDTSGNELTTYKQARDELLDALESGGRGPFIHPFFGTIDNVVCRTWNLNESMRSVGVSTIQITFAISNTTGAPEATDAVLGGVESTVEGANQDLEDSVGDNFSVTTALAGNFEDAVAKVEGFVQAIKDATEPLAQITKQIDKFAGDLADLSADIASLVQTPSALAESIRNTVSSMNALFATPLAVFNSMVRMFDFGDLDINFVTSTSRAKEKQANRDLLNNQVQGAALVEAFLAAAQLDLPTVEDINTVQAVLEDQFQKMIATGTLDSTAQEGVTLARIALADFFEIERAAKPRLIEIETHTIPARVLSFQYFGSSAQGDSIARLNGQDDSAFIEGTTKILSS